MKAFKIYDYCISAGLIISFAVITFLDGNRGLFSKALFTGYFVVGAWQVVSMLVHTYRHCFTHKFGTRYLYHWITFLSLVTAPGSFWILYFTAPFMAVFYTGLCYSEVRKMSRRPLDLLK